MTERDGNDGLAFRTSKLAFDTACFAEMTDSGTSNPSRINDVYAKVSKFRLTRSEKEVNK